jgi:hypothetical protein
MIVIRNVFQLKFGKAREAIALMKEGLAIQKRAVTGMDFSTRMLTDVTGPFYTLVLELTLSNMSTFEAYAPKLFGDKDWQAYYQKLAPLVESGHREIFTIVE